MIGLHEMIKTIHKKSGVFGIRRRNEKEKKKLRTRTKTSKENHQLLSQLSNYTQYFTL